ncbi:MAG: OPT/YSL family transporter [Lentisphaeria bacterium]|nr:OPT/YSL family transporter [Lentisphaeria bacterium]
MSTQHKTYQLDKELQEYKDLMEVPSHFDDGFTLSAFMGTLFVALIMIPGVLYMQLIAGAGVGPAAQWVTVILFIELAKRANATMKKAQIFILFYMAGAVVNQSVAGTPLFTQFLVQSEAALNAGLADQFPHWVAPENISDLPRSFFQIAWLPAVALIAFKFLFSRIDVMILGYALFRMTSDVERLPFPMAPMQAQGMMTLAEDLGESSKHGESWRWRSFSIGGAIGMVFGFLYLGIPMLSSAFLSRTIQLFPIPFVDWTPQSGEFLPAVATGLSFDLGQLILGMVMPFFAMVGSFIGLVITMINNPILYSKHILYSWKPGQSTVETMFSNNVDFYFSFSIGLALAIAIVGVVSIVRSRGMRPHDKSGHVVPLDIPPSRGDIPNWLLLVAYLLTTSTYILVSGYLINWHKGVMLVMLFFGFLYTPIISYVTARLEGLAGQVVEVPFIREIAFILSGYQGVAVWFIPIPMANYGVQTVFYKTAELTGTNFRSIWKADCLLYPIILVAMLGFSSYIWSIREIPNEAYPYTQAMWEFDAKNASLIYSSTMGGYSPFYEALNGLYIAIGSAIGLVSFGTFAYFGAPTTLCYGVVRGLNQTMPHVVVPQFIGAMLGQFYLRKKFGKQWKNYIIVVSSGYFVGSGLVGMLCSGIVFLAQSSNTLSY